MQNRTTITSITFPNGNLTMDGRISIPAGTPPFSGVVMCHPHPLYGGDMDNNVLEGVSAVLEEHHIAVLVFNFRGVGGSQGTHDRGVGEVDDALSALEYLAKHPSVDNSRLGMVGYSFGAMVALKAAARDSRIRSLALVGCPTGSLESPSVQQLVQPIVFVHGDHDPVVKPEFEALAKQLRQPPQIEVLSGADHYLLGYEDYIGTVLAGFFERTLA